MFSVLDRNEASYQNDIVFGKITGDGEGPTWETTKCSVCGRIKIQNQVKDLSIELLGTNFLDFIWLDGVNVVISDTLKSLLETSSLKGFSFRDIKISNWWRKDPSNGEMKNWLQVEQPPQLHQFVVTGRGGSILPQNDVTVNSHCEVCKLTVYEPLSNGIIVDPEQWDGSDVFYLDEFPGYILVTDNFKKFLSQNKVKGCATIPSSDYSKSSYP